ncbi:MAG TPA: glycosyltransferase family 39 protein [Gammaproteobacteria bacterium]|nr:glycosyltransferase family 39 protein [Gammaproteobacteria bacterium]
MLRSRLAWFALGAAALLRLWLAAAVPLMDTTEARYGEMARKMVESGDWLVPLHDYGVPYLAKPPLAFWFSAAGIELFGAGELGPRILILLATVAFGALCYAYVRRWLGHAAAVTALLAMVTSLLFFVAAAAVMTDMLLTIAVVVALGAFWERYRGGGAGAEVVLYVALGLGLLIKGPLAVVLALGPVAIFALLFRRVGRVWQRFAWLKGGLLALAIAAPWYVAAELRNPGFLNYFIIGEHIQRFLVPGWTGDLYGRAHDVPHGGIWLFFLLGSLPWGLLAIPWLIRARATVRARWREQRELLAFWLIAALVPLLLFTAAGNIIFPYALPALPPAALVLAALANVEERSLPWLAAVAAAAMAVVGVAAWAAGPYMESHSQRSVVRAVDTLASRADAPVYYWQTRFFSADYYGRGRVREIESEQPLERELAARHDFTLVVPEGRQESLPAPLVQRLRPIGAADSMRLFAPDYAARGAAPP